MDLLTWIAADLASVRAKLFDGVVGRVPSDQWATQADGGGSSINHLLLHLARHQDLAITTAIRNQSPRFERHRSVLGLHAAAPAVGLAEREDRDATAALPSEALLAYVTEVFDATAAWLKRIGTMALDTTPATGRRLDRLAGVTVADVPWLHSMWGDQPVWWLIQWPVLGHGHTHVGEATSVRNRLGFSPF